MGQTGVIKSQILCFFAYISLLLILQLSNVLVGNRKLYAGSLEICQIYPLNAVYIAQTMVTKLQILCYCLISSLLLFYSF